MDFEKKTPTASSQDKFSWQENLIAIIQMQGCRK